MKDEKSDNRATRPCPICRKAVSPDAATYPFCSKRCRTIDLARWADEAYVISRPIEQSDLDEE